MKIGVIGVGCIGGTLVKWFENHTTHEIVKYDPPKNMNDSLENCDAIFISVPVPYSQHGQDDKVLKESVKLAQKYTDNVFIRSTVLPGTNDSLKTISMPEFLTERIAYDDFCKHPVLSGLCDESLLTRIFPGKKIIMMKNKEAELAKYAHNCHGAMKVTFFNLINNLCKILELNYDEVLKAVMITGHVDKQYTKIAQDGLGGYGGTCFPVNVKSMIGWLNHQKSEQLFFRVIDQLNDKYRFKKNNDLMDTTAYD